MGVHDDGPRTASPFPKVEAITAVYFPQFAILVAEVDHAAIRYLVWINDTRQKRLAVVLVEMMAKEPAGSPQKVVFTKMPTIEPLILNEAGYIEDDHDGYEEANGPYFEKQKELILALTEFALENFR